MTTGRCAQSSEEETCSRLSRQVLGTQSGNSRTSAKSRLQHDEDIGFAATLCFGRLDRHRIAHLRAVTSCVGPTLRTLSREFLRPGPYTDATVITCSNRTIVLMLALLRVYGYPGTVELGRSSGGRSSDAGRSS
eukprot:242289-Rhodomonas_salina.2